MRKQGTVVSWNNARAFGFIRSDKAHADIFFHIRDFTGASAPSAGLPVSFEEIHVGGKGPRAMAVRAMADLNNPARTQNPDARNVPTTARASMSRTASRGKSETRTTHTKGSNQPGGLVVALMLLWTLLLLGAVWLGQLEWIVLPLAVVLNVVTFYIYWQDKHAARRGAWRVSEKTLHWLGLLGGWPGAWFAHQTLRHKSSKQAFRSVYWVTVILNISALAIWIAWPHLKR